MGTLQRPVSLTLISWYLIIGGAIAFAYIPVNLTNQLAKDTLAGLGIPPLGAVMLTIVNAGIHSGAGIALLGGRKWGRQLYLAGTPLLLGATVAVYGVGLFAMFIIGAVVYGVIAVFLLRPPVTAYLSGVSPADSAFPDVPAGQAGENTFTGKRIAGALLLIPGGIVLATLVMIVSALSENVLALMIVSALLGLPACAFIVPAVLLWGRRRWAVVLGTLLCAVGGMNLVLAAMLYQFMTMPQFRSQFAALDPRIMDAMLSGSLIGGVVSIIVGGLLILLQREKDRRSSGTGVDRH